MRQAGGQGILMGLVTVIERGVGLGHSRQRMELEGAGGKWWVIGWRSLWVGYLSKRSGRVGRGGSR